MGDSFLQGCQDDSRGERILLNKRCWTLGIYMLKTSLGPTPHTIQSELKMNHQPKCKS